MATQPSRKKKTLHRLMALDRWDHTLQVERITVACPNLPGAFEGTRVAVVSDLHLPDMLLPPAVLLRLLARLRPDAIFLTGDLTNSYTHFDEENLCRLAKAMAAIAPCYAIPGNHEWRLEREPLYRAALTAAGVHYLCDSYADWQRNGQTLRLYGMGRQRPAPLTVKHQPAIVLAHKPNHFPYFQKARWDVVICGHAHGGQIRLGNQALYAPGQGFLPRYTGGVYTAAGTTMVVSRGLGNSSIPWRVGNDPHLPLITLTRKESSHA